MPALQNAADNHPDAEVRRRAKSLIRAAFAEWPCSTLDGVKENPDILDGSVSDFVQAQAKLSWNGDQIHPIRTVWLVTKGSTGLPALFPERLNDMNLGEPVVVTPTEFQRMMAGVKGLVRKARDWRRGPEGEDIILNVVRRNGHNCERYSFAPRNERLHKVCYTALVRSDISVLCPHEH